MILEFKVGRFWGMGSNGKNIYSTSFHFDERNQIFLGEKNKTGSHAVRFNDADTTFCSQTTCYGSLNQRFKPLVLSLSIFYGMFAPL